MHKVFHFRYYYPSIVKLKLLCLIQIEIQLEEDGVCPTPVKMAGKVASFLNDKGFLQAR